MQTADWDLLLEKKDGEYHAHHYPGKNIFIEKEVKDLKFATLEGMNAYLAKIAKPAPPVISEEETSGECRQSPCQRHPHKGTVVQAGAWDLLVEKKDGQYHAHHYRRSFIFMEAEVKDLKFPTLKALNEYIAEAARADVGPASGD